MSDMLEICRLLAFLLYDLPYPYSCFIFDVSLPIHIANISLGLSVYAIGYFMKKTI